MKTRFSSVLAITFTTTYFALNTCGTLCAQTVSIGNQEWMMHNLDADTFRNGEPIPEAQSKKEWKAAGRNEQAAWCWYDKDPVNGAIYGRLYNWYAVADPRNLCPAGWHVPTDHDWNLLMKNLESNADTSCFFCNEYLGGYLKGTGTTDDGSGYWKSPNKGANNSSGFLGIPGGGRGRRGVFRHIGKVSAWWSSTEFSPKEAWQFFLNWHIGSSLRYYFSKRGGISVRCLKD